MHHATGAHATHQHPVRGAASTSASSTSGSSAVHVVSEIREPPRAAARRRTWSCWSLCESTASASTAPAKGAGKQAPAGTAGRPPGGLLSLLGGASTAADARRQSLATTDAGRLEASDDLAATPSEPEARPALSTQCADRDFPPFSAAFGLAAAIGAASARVGSVVGSAHRAPQRAASAGPSLARRPTGAAGDVQATSAAATASSKQQQAQAVLDAARALCEAASSGEPQHMQTSDGASSSWSANWQHQ